MHNIYRLFFGDTSLLNVASIRIIKRNLNLEKVIKAITVLDNCISYKLFREISGSYGYGLKLRTLFDYILYGKKEKKWHQYVYDTFQCFVRNKTMVHINIDYLVHLVKDEELLSLIFHKLEKNNKEIMEEETSTNLIKPQFFRIFDNVEEIIIGSFNSGFSLFGFLSLITNTKINKVLISGNWLRERWDSCGEEIVEKFATRNFKVVFSKDYNQMRISR